MSRSRSRMLLAFSVLTSLVAVVPASSAGATVADLRVMASFEGQMIDISDGWGEAEACAVRPEGIACFRTEGEMDGALAVRLDLELSLRGLLGILSACATSVKLYDGASYGLPVLDLYNRSTLHNLSTYSFDNITSSYKIGACSAEFYSGSGTGAYPGNTSAGVQSPSMSAGWNNLVSSVIIY